MTDVSEVMDLENVEASGEVDDDDMRDMVQKAVLLYYMAKEGKDPTSFFGQGDSFKEAGLVGGVNPATGEAYSLNPITQPLIRGAHEMSMGAFDLVGGGELKSSGATIRDDLKRKSVVSADVQELFSNAGIETPENIKSWSRPDNFERIQDIATDVTTFMLSKSLYLHNNTPNNQLFCPFIKNMLLVLSKFTARGCTVA